jgi:hypothetical protein
MHGLKPYFTYIIRTKSAINPIFFLQFLHVLEYSRGVKAKFVP